tara:strand:- start:1984 stop:2298 length:315 start_codon:yes stop_codon:yes gene_type:complete
MSVIHLVPKDFINQLASSPNHVLIDVREDHEYEDFNLGGINIPMGDLLSRIDEVKDYQNLFLCCKSGKRSQAIAFHLKNKMKDKAVYSLDGGLEAYQKTINVSV